MSNAVAEVGAPARRAVQLVAARRWVGVCPLDRIQPERGIAALVDGQHVAVFRLHDGSVHAVANIDPFTGRSVLSRGIVGTRNGTPVVFSPLFKQAFDLDTGQCVDDPTAGHDLAVWQVRVVDGQVQIGAPTGSDGARPGGPGA